jgi:hypothetical protein
LAAPRLAWFVEVTPLGTDIHCFAEHHSGRRWRACRDPGLSADGASPLLSFYCGQERNYELFAILAGVRRLTNAGFEPYRPPRGLPVNLSPMIRELAAEDTKCLCVHNHSWLTLRELLDFPWQEKKRRYEGYVDSRQYDLFRTSGRPLQMFPYPEHIAAGCGGKPVFGRAQIVSNRKMERHSKSGKETQGILTKITFEIPYAEFCSPFVQETLPVLGTFGKPHDVRIVFWFDS